jgi:hypothetical protein
MQHLYLNNDWEAEEPKTNYWQLLSYILFVAFLFTAFWASIMDAKYTKAERFNAGLKQENLHLKSEINSANEVLKSEYDITDRVIKKYNK